MSLRDLNRALLARQMLLAREAVEPQLAVFRLAGLQAQMARPPVVGLWSRLEGLTREAVLERLMRRDVVRATAMRGTLHLLAAEDYVQFRPLLEPMLHRAYEGTAGARGTGIDPEKVATVGKRFLKKNAPCTMETLRVHLEEQFPGLDVRMMGYAVRLFLPLVQVPESGHAWGFPAEPAFDLAEKWIGRAPAMMGDSAQLAWRYLEAFGPATARDMQTWSGLGLPVVREAIALMRPRLEVLRDEEGRELFDVPGAPRPGGDAEAPVRFLPEWDNLLLGHADRTRIVPPEFRKKTFLAGLRVAPTFLVDGFVRGAWRVEHKRRTATLHLEPFARITKAERAALEAEGEALVRFVEPEARAHTLAWAE